jgi:hypothetical protein
VSSAFRPAAGWAVRRTQAASACRRFARSRGRFAARGRAVGAPRVTAHRPALVRWPAARDRRQAALTRAPAQDRTPRRARTRTRRARGGVGQHEASFESALRAPALATERIRAWLVGRSGDQGGCCWRGVETDRVAGRDCMAPTRLGRRRGIGAVTGVSSGRHMVGSSVALVRLAGLRSNRPPRDAARLPRQLARPHGSSGWSSAPSGSSPKSSSTSGGSPQNVPIGTARSQGGGSSAIAGTRAPATPRQRRREHGTRPATPR